MNIKASENITFHNFLLNLLFYCSKTTWLLRNLILNQHESFKIKGKIKVHEFKLAKGLYIYCIKSSEVFKLIFIIREIIIVRCT